MDDIASETQTLADDHSTEQFLQQELAIAEILPEGIWIKCTKSKKVGMLKYTFNVLILVIVVN